MLSKDVDWSALPATTPASIVTLLRRCLERDPKRRLRDIGEARLILAHPEQAVPATSGITVSPPPASFASRPARRWRFPAITSWLLAQRSRAMGSRLCLCRLMASGGPDCTHADSTSPNRKAYYAYTWPFGLPGDTALLFNRWGGTAEDLMRLNLADMSQDVIAPRQWRRSTRTASGHIVFSAEGGDFLGIPDGPTGRAPEPLIANMAGGDDPDGYTVSEPDVAVDAGWTLGQGWLVPPIEVPTFTLRSPK